VSTTTSIGVTGPDKGGLIAWWMTAWAVRRCGGRAVRITPSGPREAATLQGFIIGGGTDVDPFHYGESAPGENPDNPDEHSGLLDWLVGLILGLFRLAFATGSHQNYDPDRDHLEQHLIQYALYHDLPVLGICRGAQLMNVVLGGTLHHNIEHFYYMEQTNNVRSILPRKRVTIADDSRLLQILGSRECVVNALHNQSIKDLGDGIIVSATENSGVIQAIECPAQRYFVGVQWHPEYMPQYPTQKNLFRELLRNAAVVQTSTD